MQGSYDGVCAGLQAKGIVLANAAQSGRLKPGQGSPAFAFYGDFLPKEVLLYEKISRRKCFRVRRNNGLSAIFVVEILCKVSAMGFELVCKRKASFLQTLRNPAG